MILNATSGNICTYTTNIISDYIVYTSAGIYVWEDKAIEFKFWIFKNYYCPSIEETIFESNSLFIVPQFPAK